MTTFSLSLSSTAIQAVIAVLEDLAPLVENSAAVTNVITFLEEIIPAVTQEVEDLAAPIRNIIGALSDSGAATADQVAALTALDASADAAFDAAAQAWAAANPGA